MCQIIDYEYEVVDVISIRDGKILLVKKRDFWILPGGKREKREFAHNCIVRELSEELPGCRLASRLVYFCHFQGRCPHGKKIRVRCYLGNIEGDISPGAEISDARWIPKGEIFSYPLSEITLQIVKKIFEEKII